MNRKILHIALCLFIFSCSKDEKKVFELLSPEKSGITFANNLEEKKGQNILDYLYYYNGGGVAIGDINNDGLPDVFFTSNQSENKLYLNKGNLQFKDISESAGIQGKSDWNTGVAMADVNGDGLLDIYVCAVVGINGFDGHNELFINNGDNTFTEQSGKYGLDFDNYSSTASFFDYDLDGDLDMYLLNHAIHTQESFGKASIRNNRNYESGDKLLRNDGGTFTDVSEEAGIYGGVNGYGLGVAISDFNNDNYPDIYVSNDFHEDDYYYINNGDGTFTESLKDYFGHVSKFSMGSDVADVNHDGYPDLMTLDMLPEDESVLKSSAGDDNSQLQKMRISKFGYHYQYSRNMLQINQRANHFTETALSSGVAATDWSWSVLIADYNQDGKQDLFIANGIPKRPNDLDYIKYTSNQQIQKKLSTTNLIDQEALDYMPEAKLKNAFYQGDENAYFQNKTEGWTTQTAGFSTGSAYGDLDNDGDLDLITNNINEPASVYINQTNDQKNYLKIKLDAKSVGAKVYAYSNGKLQFRELYSQRGFQSSSEPMIHFGLDTISVLDSVKFMFPNGNMKRLTNVPVNQTLVTTPDTKGMIAQKESTNSETYFRKVEGNFGIDYKHRENDYVDSNRHRLIPFQVSDRGPALAVGDLNGDGKDDIYLGNAKFQEAAIYLQTDNGFEKLNSDVLSKNKITEAVDAVIVDINQDAKNELFIASGGGEFFGKAPALQNELYQLHDADLTSIPLPEDFSDSSVVKAADIDQDGDIDFFIGNAVISNDYGAVPESYVLINEGGKFTQSSLGKLGMIRDAIFTDFNQDNQEDLVIVGEWIQPIFLVNESGSFKNVSKNYLSDQLGGLWRSIIAFDIDKDGDQDYLLGNWGTNTKFKASQEFPMKMFYADFDGNEQKETIVAIEKEGNYYPLESLDELSMQMVSIFKKKFPTYQSFAGKKLDEIIESKNLKSAKVFEVNTLQSGYLENNNGQFQFKPFSKELQMAPINDFEQIEIKGESVIICGGNYFGVNPYHGRFDGFSGAIIKSENDMILGYKSGLDFFNKEVVKLKKITINQKHYIITAIHDNEIQIYEVE